MEAGIRLDAYPDRVLKGMVSEVNEYPAASGWMGPAVKEYETIIKILEPPSDLRPGFTAEVKIRVEQLDNVLQVPVQAIIEHGRKLYASSTKARGTSCPGSQESARRTTSSW